MLMHFTQEILNNVIINLPVQRDEQREVHLSSKKKQKKRLGSCILKWLLQIFD